MVREEGGECGSDLSLVVCLLLIHTLAVHRHCAEFITKSIHKPCITAAAAELLSPQVWHRSVWWC
jgi:hypothetical protein